MKNFNIAALCLAFACAIPSAAVQAQSTTNNTRCTFLSSAPDQHVVVRGDTLWDISGKFLQHPWCWPQVWDINRDQIRNPHWIYPGQIVYFDRLAGKLKLGTGNTLGDTPTVRLSPHIRGSQLTDNAIASIPLGEISQFLTQPLIVDVDELAHTPRIVAAREGRVVLGNDDTAYVRGDLQDKTEFHAFRAGKALKDPASGKIIGYEAAFLGDLQLRRSSTNEQEPHSFVITQVKEEIGIGDRLMPVEATPFINYVPHAPAQAVTAQIASVYGGVSQAGQNQIVTINRGKNDGIDIGTVLQLQRLGQTMVDTTSSKRETIKLPDERYGNLFIFRVFNNISYGLVMQVTDTVQVGDIASSPE